MNQSNRISSHQRSLLLGLSAAGVIGLSALVIFSQDDSCAGILQQTAPRLESNLEIIKNKGSVAVSRERIQELSESAQRVGLHLKTCCIVLEGGKLDSDQFQQCVDKAAAYDQRIEVVARQVTAVAQAGELDTTPVSQEQIDNINQLFSDASEDAEDYVRQVEKIDRPVTHQKSVSGTSVRRVASNLLNVSVDLLEFSRFENTLTLKLRIVNDGEENQHAELGSGSYLLDERSGDKYMYTVYPSQGYSVKIPAGGSVNYWVKYTMPEGEWPKHLTAVLNHGVLLEQLEIPQ